MAILKRTTAFLTAVMMTACVAGCSDTSYALKADNKEIKAGIYIDYLYNEITNQVNTLAYSGSTESPLKQKIDGKKFSEYVEDVALTKTKEHVAINNKFKELKLALDKEEIKQLNSNISSTWDESGEDYEKQGISKESLKEVSLTSGKRTAVFDSFYGKGGTEEVSDKEIIKYVNDNYLRFKILSFAKNSEDETATKESKESRDKYLKLAKGVGFDEFDTIITAYQEEQQKKQQEAQQQESQGMEIADTYDLDNDTEVTESAATTEAETKDADTAEDKTLSNFEAQNEADSVVEVTDAKADSEEADEDVATAEDADVATAEEAATTGEEETAEEADPYANEQMLNFGSLSDEDLTSDYGKLLSEIKGMKENKVTSYENDSAYYIIIKGKVSDRSKEYVADEDTHKNVLTEMKGDDFQKKIDSWVKKIKFTVNEDALKTFSASNVYKIMNEVKEEQNNNTAQ